MNEYRPQSFDAIIGQPTEDVEPLVDGADTPNMLFHGPPGNGKTSTVYCIVREIHGDLSELAEYNASNKRRVDDVRNDIIPAARMDRTLTGKPVIIYLDEMDQMTHEAQQALKSPMEQTNAIWLLSCNDISGVDTAIRSRCHDFEYEPVDSTAIKERLRQVADAEGWEYKESHLDSIVSFANGDVRTAIQKLRERAGADPGNDGQNHTIEQAAQNFS